jgi:hypothetical protein
MFIYISLPITIAAPIGIAENGSVCDNSSRVEHYWGQACQYLDRGVQVEAGNKGVLRLIYLQSPQERFVGSILILLPSPLQWSKIPFVILSSESSVEKGRIQIEILFATRSR